MNYYNLVRNSMRSGQHIVGIQLMCLFLPYSKGWKAPPGREKKGYLSKRHPSCLQSLIESINIYQTFLGMEI